MVFDKAVTKVEKYISLIIHLMSQF